MSQSEMIFSVKESPEGGYEARALKYSIFTQADTLDEPKAMLRDAVGVPLYEWRQAQRDSSSHGNGRGDSGLKLPRQFLFLGIAALLLCVVAKSGLAQQPTIRFVRNPDPAPAFKVSTVDGKPLTLADYNSKVILLNFWATWCGPCRSEIPELVELQNKYKDQLQIIGLVVDDDDEDGVRKFVEKFGINYPIAMATDEMRMEYGGIPALPTSFVLDGEGRVVQKHEGLRDPVLYEMEIRSLLGMPIGNVKVETFDDTGQIFLKHADRATQLPGVNLSKLTPEQRTLALHKFNAESCSCGCQYTLAQCRIWDRNCNVSKEATAKIIDAIAGKAGQGTDASAPVKPAKPSSSPMVEKQTTAEKPDE